MSEWVSAFGALRVASFALFVLFAPLVIRRTALTGKADPTCRIYRAARNMLIPTTSVSTQNKSQMALIIC
ncbi:hypothetical protein ABH945_002315 [Paraburkholderia sp. GAS333]|uniref:hypothetical protein n=1 Tax=Paraburkholderia sp. GAS333 TaxID=3156279 RepID=UPI003D2609AE